ncbi:MAG: cell division FtsA domain-containing protein [Christensenellales bacterium]|jgi:cell division protein FtsA
MKKMTAIIEFGTSKTVCLVAKNHQDGYSLIGGASAPLQEDALQDIGTAAASVRSVVDEVAAKTKVRLRDVVVGVPGQFCSIAIVCADLDLGEDSKQVDDADIDRLIFSAQNFKVPKGFEILHRCPVSYKLDGRRVLEPCGMTGKQLSGQICFLFAETSFLKEVRVMLGREGLHALDFVAVPLALGLLGMSAKERDDVAVLIDSGYNVTNVSMFRGDGMVFHAVMNRGGYDFARRLAEGMDIPLEDAEQLKKRFAFGLDTVSEDSFDVVVTETGQRRRYSHRRVQEIMEAAASEFLQDVRAVLEDCDVRLKKNSRIFFAGGGFIMNRGSKELAEKMLERDVSVVRADAAFMGTPNFAAAHGVLHFAAGAFEEPEQGSFLAGLPLFKRLLQDKKA